MKRSLWIVLGILLVVPGQARVIPRERAAATATEVLGNFQSAPDVRLVKETSGTYIFENEGGGYAIVAAEDCAVPVLGYSPSGRFPVDDMPDNLRSMLDWYDSVIDYACKQGWTATTRERPSVQAGEEGEVLLHTVPWHQDYPFNDLCPRIRNQACPSGCVATAIAIIMKYHSYPDHGTGSLPAYDYGSGRYHMDGHDLGHTYHWDMMPDRAKSFSKEEAAEIAQLLFDVGVMCQMDYSPQGSGAVSNSPLKMARYFGYDKGMRYVDRAYYTTGEWEKMMRDEIDAGRPVFHCGYDRDGGHAFVVDGYKGRYFSVNLGWGDPSSYFLMSPVDGHDAELIDFIYYQSIVTHIQPDIGSEPYIDMSIPYDWIPLAWDFQSKTMPGGGLQVLPNATVEANIDVAYAHFDRNNQFKQVLSPIVSYSVDDVSAVYPEVTVNIPESIADGDCIALARRQGDTWVPLTQSRHCYMRFDLSRKLKQMVSFGCFGGISTQGGSGNKTRTLFFDMYQDLRWEIQSEDGSTVYITSSFDWWDEPCRVEYGAGQVSDDEPDLMRYFCYLKIGKTYRMVIRNVNETMSFTFSL